MVIDLHNHTNLYSLCSVISPDDLINIYIENKIDGICLTEHNILWEEEKQNLLIDKYKNKIKIFFGIEVDTDLGHILIYPEKNQDLDYIKFENIKFLELINKIDLKKNGIIWAHPLRWAKLFNRDKYINNNYLKYMNAIELFNGNLDTDTINQTEKKFSFSGLKFTGGSDTHCKEMACKYGTKFENNIDNQKDFVYNLINCNYNPIKLNKI